MASKKCAREECGKTVYPIEELKCLDKVWHKQCFKCSSCGMTLSMKNYKGYDKKPYCEAHYPKTVATVVAETPEMKRLADNTKFQSQVKYHEAYEKMKGTKMEIADDPELMRHMKNTKAQSLVQYHGESERKKEMETNRPKEELTSNVPSSTSTTFSAAAVYNQPVGDENSYGSSNNDRGSISSYGVNTTTMPTSNDSSPYTQRLLANQGAVVYSSENGGRVPTEQRQVGSIADYDPLNGDWGTSAASKTAEKLASAAVQRQQQQQAQAAEAQQKQTSAAAQKNTSSPSKVSTPASQPAQPAAAAAAPAQARAQTGFTVKALYDYTAADNDEVSFKENDIIVNCAKVDDGWMTGTVQRTLTWGMLPANYVERVNQPTGLFKLN